MKKLAAFIASAGVFAPKALAHTGHDADHSHQGVNFSAWLEHIFTTSGHEALALALGIVVAGGIIVYLRSRAGRVHRD